MPVKERIINLALPGSQRYKSLLMAEIFGYDMLYRPHIEVELVVMRCLQEIGVIGMDDMQLLTDKVVESLMDITTSEVDRVEREVTKHDMRALVQVMQARMPEPLRRWVHVPLTSYDVISTATALQFKRAYERVIAPKLREVIEIFAQLAVRYADTLQIGRTHGQHAVPITVGFWLASILSRLVDSALLLKTTAGELVGKISGPVGAYNAQTAIGIYKSSGANGLSFEERVMLHLGLKAAPVSTQIVPPEPLARHLHAYLQVIAALGQFGTDARQLMRSEIGELCEPFAAGQVGSSTMAHKRNPITFEGLVGTHIDAVAEYLKVQLTAVSEHQRDLTGSSVARDFAMLPLLLDRQLNPLLRKDKEERAFLARVTVDQEACQRNFEANARLTMAEQLYLALQMHGYRGDAHELVNRKLVPVATQTRDHLVDILEHAGKYKEVAPEDWAMFADAFSLLPPKVVDDLRHPERYVGRAPEIARETAVRAREIAAALA
jgi:adenylosuccinate lyase